MNIARENILKLYPGKPISEEALHEARYKFEEKLRWPPKQLMTSVSARNELLIIVRPFITKSLEPKTIFGLEIDIDPKLKPGEWYLQLGNEIVEAVE